jgi:hypothetical protein
MRSFSDLAQFFQGQPASPHPEAKKPPQGKRDEAKHPPEPPADADTQQASDNQSGPADSDSP